MHTRQPRWLVLLVLLGLSCAADDRVVYSDEEPTEPLPARSSGEANKPVAASKGPGLEYWRALLADPARKGERFDYVRRLAEGQDRVHPELVGSLKRLLADKNDGLRAHAVQALGRSGDAGARHALVKALGDRAATVREAAIEALVAMQGKGVDARLTALLEERNNRTRRAAAAAVGRRVGAGFPGRSPGGLDAVEHMLYLERVAVVGREDLFRDYIAPGRKGRSAGFLYRVTPTVDDEDAVDAPRPQSFRIYAPELNVKRFSEELAPGLMVDLESDGAACTAWKRNACTCRCVTDSGERYRVRLRKVGKKVRVSEIEWFPRPAQ